MSTKYTFREIAGLTTFLKLLLGLGMVLAAVSLLSSLMELQLLNRGTFSELEWQANQSREQIIGRLQFALHWFTVVLFGCWIVRANRNVRALGAGGLRITPGWAVGYFFIPIINLWRPYQAMKDLWQASHTPVSWGSSPVERVNTVRAPAGQNPPLWACTPASLLLPTWWGLWLLYFLLTRIASSTPEQAQALEDIKAAAYVQVMSQVVYISLCFVAMKLVSSVACAQTVHAEERHPTPL